MFIDHGGLLCFCHQGPSELNKHVGILTLSDTITGLIHPSEPTICQSMC